MKSRARRWISISDSGELRSERSKAPSCGGFQSIRASPPSVDSRLLRVRPMEFQGPTKALLSSGLGRRRFASISATYVPVTPRAAPSSRSEQFSSYTFCLDEFAKFRHSANLTLSAYIVKVTSLRRPGLPTNFAEEMQPTPFPVKPYAAQRCQVSARRRSYQAQPDYPDCREVQRLQKHLSDKAEERSAEQSQDI